MMNAANGATGERCAPLALSFSLPAAAFLTGSRVNICEGGLAAREHRKYMLQARQV